MQLTLIYIISSLDLILFRELLIVILLLLLSPTPPALLTLTVSTSALTNIEAFITVLVKLLSLKEVYNTLV